MSVFGNIMSSIFGHGAKAQPSAPTASKGPAVAGANTPPAPRSESPTHGSGTPTASPGPAGGHFDAAGQPEQREARLAQIDRRSNEVAQSR
jgi:hypothetical protein